MAGRLLRACAALAWLAAPSTRAGELEAHLRDAAGQPIADAVVSLRPSGSPAPPRVESATSAVMDQRGKQFAPFVLAVQRGTPVVFPNSDQIRHHVYSFSEPKPFELRLYAGTPAAPVVFDKPGTVVLGCNIHDRMLAFVRVVETPWFAKTDPEGRARIAGVPPGSYAAELWHPRLPAGAAVPERAVEIGAGTTELGAVLELGPPIAPAKSRRGLRYRRERGASAP